MVGYHGLGWNKILMELGWILLYTKKFFRTKKGKFKWLEILHRAQSWDVETLCSSDFTNQPNWIWILSHIDLQHNDKKKTETMRDQNP